MAQVQRYRRAIAAALLGLVALAFAPGLANDQGSKDATDLYDRPVLAIDPGMHTAKIWSEAIDAAGRFAVTGSDDRTVRIWSLADGTLQRTIWIPVGPEYVGAIYAVAISPDGSTIAAGGWTDRLLGDHPIYIFDRESGNLIRRIADDLPNVSKRLTFSPDGRYLAATLGGGKGLRVFDRDANWREVFRDEEYRGDSYGAAFTRDGRLATTSFDGLIRSYQYDPSSDSPNFRRVGEPIKAPSGHLPFRTAFSPDGKRLAVGYRDVAAVDVLDGTTLQRVGGQMPVDATPLPDGLINVAWSDDSRTLFAAGAVNDAQDRRPLFAWDRGGLGDERRMTYCTANAAAGVEVLQGERVLVASTAPCLSLMDADGHQVWIAHDVATALLESQRLGPGKASLYADVKVTYLPNDKASKTAIGDALDAMAESMAKSGADQDTAVILVSSHGEMIGGQFYLIPYGFVGNGTRNAATDSAVPASVFAEKVSALAAHGKVLVLLDACHSGAISAGGWATDPNAKVLQDAMDFENVTVLTSSKRSELSEELPEWKHGALAQAFLDALAGAADSKGIVTRSALTDAMENEVQSLTKGKQHLGMHVNFSGDLFVAGHY